MPISVPMQTVPDDIPGIVPRSYENQDIAKFSEGLPIWKSWLPQEAFQEWCDFVTEVEIYAPIDVSRTYWPLDNIHGTYKSTDVTKTQTPRISERDVVVPQVSVCTYMHS